MRNIGEFLSRHAIRDLLLKHPVLYPLVLWLHNVLQTIESVQIQRLQDRKYLVRQHLTEGPVLRSQFLSLAD